MASTPIRIAASRSSAGGPVREAVLPVMASQGSGAVVNLGSDAGRAGSSGEAPFVTGQTISVSGGLTMS